MVTKNNVTFDIFRMKKSQYLKGTFMPLQNKNIYLVPNTIDKNH